MQRTLLWLAGIASLGCSQAASSSAQPPPARSAPAAPASEAAGMCKDHGVLEAVCTKCNPNLIPIFQAKGDWCKEHEFPESFCPICHPERGGRPTAAVVSDGAPADGTKVRFKSADTAQLAGIKTVPAELRPGGVRLGALANLSFDATKRAEVNGRASGVIREVAVDVGARVKAGDVLAVVDSATVGADQGRMRASEARMSAAQTTLDRETRLVEAGISARRDALAARTELDSARAEQDSIRAALGMVGGTGGTGRYTIRAPLAGTVLRRLATVGRLVGPEELLFEIADTSTMWADIEVPEREAGRVELGQTVELEVDAIPGRVFDGRIEYVAPDVERRTRTVLTRATVANADGKLRANMFGKARIALGGTQPSVMVPRAAVQRAKGVSLVFVRVSEAEFEARRVKTGSADSGTIELTTGVKPGEAVATEGSFLLKTETLKDSIGAGCCDAD